MPLFALLLPNLSRAEPRPSDASADVAPAEHVRLSDEMELLASKNAWAGAERTFQQLLATGAPLSFDDWIRGAEAAKAIGDIGAVRARLLAANALTEERRVIEWLWDIDQRYGAVELLCSPGSYLALSPEISSLDPDVRRAIELARRKIHDACRFEGLLPVGHYTLHEMPFEVLPMRPVLHIDLRGVEIDKTTRRALKEAWLLEP